MRILELNFEKGWRGGERQTIYTMQGFKDAGTEVALLCRKNTALHMHATAEGFTVYPFNNIFGVFFFLMFQARSFDVLHAQTSQILTYCVFTRLFHRAKVFYTRRVAFAQKGGLTKLKYSLTDKIIGISNAVAYNLKTFTGRNDIAVIPDAIMQKQLDVKRAEQLKASLNIGQGITIIATVAVMNTEKDPLTMVDAIRLLASKRRDFVMLHFGDGPLEADVKQKIMEYGLEDVYKTVGFYDDIEDFYSIFDVFVLSSVQEGMGSSVLDAFVYKVPVVATDAGGLAELIHNGRGIMCRVKSPQMLADGIELLLEQPQLKDKMAADAHSYANTTHSIQAITSQYLSLLK